ncbi:MAG: polysaccharide deacetylase family protein [Rhodospirillales bacterium]|nr:polysaccharide deacetylase family protein [Rhodospirillales bacterium]
MKAIMYHYVRPTPAHMDHFRYLHIDDFRMQLDWLSEHQTFISREDFDTAIHEKKSPEGIVLTFDDSLADHYKYVLPELKKRGLWGIFYVPTAIYHSKKILDVHRTHILLGHYGGKVSLKKLNAITTKEMMSDDHTEEYDKYTYVSQDNDNATTTFKKILNYFISYKYRDIVLTELINEYLGSADESSLVPDFYMTKEQIKEVHDAGMIIGSHGVNHLVMSKLNLAEQEKEIAESFSDLENITGRRPFTFCYPYGGFHTFTDQTEQLLEKYGSKFSFNVEGRDILSNDIQDRPQALPRYDCNTFPFGKASYGQQRP